MICFPIKLEFNWKKINLIGKKKRIKWKFNFLVKMCFWKLHAYHSLTPLVKQKSIWISRGDKIEPNNNLKKKGAFNK